jgi:hypothetical protein
MGGFGPPTTTKGEAMKIVQKERLFLQEVLPLIEGGADTVIKMKKASNLPDNELRIVIRFGLGNWVRTGGTKYQRLVKTSPKTYAVKTQGR